MSEKIFAFEIGQLVTLENGVQGQVSERKDFGWREPEYHVQYQQSKVYRPDGGILGATRVVSESDLVSLQPPEMVTRASAEIAAEVARFSVTAEFGNEIAAMQQRIDRMVRNAKRKRAKAKKPTHNRRRR